MQLVLDELNKLDFSQPLSVKNIRRIRPGQGVEPKYFEKLLNKVSPFDLEAGEPVTMSIIKRLKI